jgi:hypothetical protein
MILGGEYSLMRSLSRGMNFGGVYLDLIKNIRTVTSFPATQMQEAEGRDGHLAIVASTSPLETKKNVIGWPSADGLSSPLAGLACRRREW